MKKNVLFLKLFSLALGFVLLSATANAQTTAIASGPWNSAGTWSAGVPVAGVAVTIPNNFAITVPLDAACASITITGGITGSISVANGATLTVSGNITLENQVTTTRAFSVSGAGTITCANLIVGLQITPTDDETTTFTTNIANLTISNNLEIQSEDEGADENNATFNLQSGTVTVGGSVDLDEEGGFSSSVLNFNMASGGQSGTLVLTGATPFVIAGTPTVNLNGTGTTVRYSGAAQTVLGTTYNNLDLSGGAKTIAGVTVNTRLIMNDGVTVNAAPTYSSAIIEYAGTVAKITGSEFVNNATVNIEVNNTGGVSLPAARALNGNLTLTAGTFTAGNFLSFDGGERNITVDAGVYSGVPQSVGTGDDYNVTYIGSSKTTGNELSGVELDDIIVNLTAGQTLTLGANRAPDDDITVSVGTFDLGAFTLNSGAATQSFTVSNGATLRIGGINSLPTGYNYAFGASSTADFNGTVQAINAATYGNLSVNGINRGSDFKTLINNVTVVGDLFIGLEGNLSLGIRNIAMTASGNREAWIQGQLNIDNTGRLTQSGSGIKHLHLGVFGVQEAGRLYLTASSSTMPTFDTYKMESNSVVFYAATNDQAVLGNVEYGNLVTGLDGLGGIPGSGIKTISISLEVINSVVIGPGTILRCAAGGVNADNITVGGTWLNAGTFEPNDDRVIFDGSSTQELRGPNVTTFNNLQLDKDDPTFGMRLVVDAIVTGQMTFTTGFFETLTNQVLILNAGATVTGASDNSYAACAVRKIGNTGFVFPVGKDGIYSPVTITAPDNLADAYQAEYIRGNASALGPVQPGIGLSNVSFCEYWRLDEINDIGTNSSLGVTVTWDAQSPCSATPYITNVAALTLAHFNETTDVWDSHAGTATGNNTTGSLTRLAVTDFSPFSFGNTLSGANPLPVKFSSITAFEKQAGIQIDWIAYEEVNVDAYMIERSADGYNFTTIGSVASANSAVEKKYGFFDANPLPGVSYYRLRNIDFDGKTALSNVVRVNLDKTVKDIRLYPNPVNSGYVSLQSSDLARGMYTVAIYNAGGQRIMSKQFNHNGGSINQTVQLPANTQSGLYMLQLDNDGVRVMAKSFIVQQ